MKAARPVRRRGPGKPTDRNIGKAPPVRPYLANQRLDEVRRRTQNETHGHRGRKGDPLYGARRLLTAASERISDRGRTRLRGLLDAGDPHGEVRTAWHAKETVRDIYDIDSIAVALQYTLQLADDLQDESCPPRSTNWVEPSPAGPPDHELAHLEGDQPDPPKPSTT